MGTPKDEPYKLRQREFKALLKRTQDARVKVNGRDTTQEAQFRNETITHLERYSGAKGK